MIKHHIPGDGACQARKKAFSFRQPAFFTASGGLVFREFLTCRERESMKSDYACAVI